MTLPLKVAPKDWYAKHERLKPTVPRATEINAALRDWKAEAMQMLAEGKSDEAIRERLIERAGRTPVDESTERVPSILDRHAEYERELETRTKASTRAAAASSRVYLEAYIQQGADTGTLTLESSPSEIGLGFMNGYQRHVSSTGLGAVTVNKHVRRIRAFLRFLYQRGHIDRVPEARALRTAKNAPIYLESAELSAIAAVDLSALPAGYRDARDIFVACCTTGQRFSDVIGMQWDEVQRLDTDGKLTWHLTTQKTGDVLEVPLVGHTRRCVEARLEAKAATPMPRLSNQHMNTCLRVVCKQASEHVPSLASPVKRSQMVGGERREETRPKHDWITSHAGRRTFVTLFLDGENTSAKDLIGYTHGDLRTLQRYAGRSESERRDQITNTFEAL